MKEHPDIVKFCHFSAYVRTRSAGILRGLTPWHTDFGTKSSVLHLVRGVQAPGTHVRSDYSQTRYIGGRPSSHKANLIPQNKRQDTTIIAIPCLCSFVAPIRPFSGFPANKNVPEPFFRKNRVRVRTVWWGVRSPKPCWERVRQTGSCTIAAL